MLRQSSDNNSQQRQQELGHLSRRLQSRIGELDLICEQLGKRKDKVRGQLKSPLVSVLEGGKGLKRSFAKVVGQEKMRVAERDLLSSCLQAVHAFVKGERGGMQKKLGNTIEFSNIFFRPNP